MGNCQAIDAAVLVIQHPSGKIERLYWPVTVSEVMRNNPGHYVSLIIPLPSVDANDQDEKYQEPRTVQFTRVKLLRPTDTLALGHAYRLVTTQEVMKVLRAKKQEKTKRPQQQTEPVTKEQTVTENTRSERKAASESSAEHDQQVSKHERRQSRMQSTNAAALRPKSWRPSLQSISEASG